MLNFTNVNFSYDKQLEVLNKLNIKFIDNKINCIIGPSAAGKSTLLNLIAKTIQPQGGKINNSYHNLSYLFQEERLINEINVYKNLDLILKSVYKDSRKRHSIIIRGLRSVGLKGTSNWYPEQLSGSMKRRLALLRAFIYPTQLLLMDEPFTGLDINVKQNVMKLFIKLWNKDKRTVIFVSHDLDETLLVAHYIYVMSNKPMQIMQTINVNQSHKNRTLYQNKIIDIKKNLLLLTKKW